MFEDPATVIGEHYIACEPVISVPKEVGTDPCREGEGANEKGTDIVIGKASAEADFKHPCLVEAE